MVKTTLAGAKGSVIEYSLGKDTLAESCEIRELCRNGVPCYDGKSGQPELLGERA